MIRYLGAIGLVSWIALDCRAQPACVVVGAPEPGVQGIGPGEILLNELNCAACHSAPKKLGTRFPHRPAPLLGDASQRLTREYLETYLRNPIAEKPGLLMPNLLGGLPKGDTDEIVLALVSYLTSLAPKVEQAAPVSASSAVVEGRMLYHQIGCVACHAPKEPASTLFAGMPFVVSQDEDAAQYVLGKLDRDSVPLGRVDYKYRPGRLAAFLLDPVSVRPAGRMPSHNLTLLEAGALAAYVIEVQSRGPMPQGRAGAGSSSMSGAAETSAREQIGRGKALFASLGCAACHQLGRRLPNPKSRLKARQMSALNSTAEGGCLSESPRRGVPRFHLSVTQRAALAGAVAGLGRLPQRAAGEGLLVRSLAAFNCYSCHSRNGQGGPTPSRSDYFTYYGNLDLGDEGRIPPHLSDLENKLRPNWIQEVLARKGAVRPYMAVRMPQCGKSADAQITLALDALEPVAAHLPEVRTPPDALELGRRLVGVGGCSCISCHRFGQGKSTGMSVMDMTQMTKRLKKDWFRRYLLAPATLRPGTRMPSFWPDRVTVVKGVLDGDVDLQIEAIWQYLEQGPKAKPPSGFE